ncbi:MAG: hypothetical protein Q4G59_05795 [Planctomycetia bacterium]|nr:hypothetical protein [Planctomycetia bacterium]
MTVQVHDQFEYQNDLYRISAVSDELHFFEIGDVGLFTMFSNTACWRGYVAIFAIDDAKRLVLKTLHANPVNFNTPDGKKLILLLEERTRLLEEYQQKCSTSLEERILDLNRKIGFYTNWKRENACKTIEDAPKINNIIPKKRPEDNSQNSSLYFYEDYLYENIQVPISYTGSLLICKDFIEDCYVHMGFQSPMSFKTVIELEFEQGKLRKETDRSEQAERYRNSEKPSRNENMVQWIDECFDLGFSAKWNFDEE